MKLDLFYSTVTSATDVRPKRVRASWSDLVKRLQKPEIRGNKKIMEYLSLPRKQRAALKNGPGWIPATFDKGGKRVDEDVKKLYCFIGDCDNTKGSPITLASLRATLRGFEAVIHTTYSHSRERPKFRFVIPLTHPVDQGKYPALFAHFNSACGGGLDPKGKTPSQLYYWPSYPPGAEKLFRFEHLKGKAFNPDDAKDVKQDKRDANVDLPEDLPEVDIEQIELTERIRELIRTGEDPSKRYASRSEALFAVTLALISRGLNDSLIAGILLDPRYGISSKVLEQKKPRRYVMVTLRKARSAHFVGDAKTIEEAIKEMNQRHAVVNVGGRCLILTEGEDPVLKRREVNLGYVADLRLQYGNKKILVNEKAITIADLWLQNEHRRQYDRIIFSPEQDIPACYNLWRGFSCVPRKGDCSLYLEHIRDNIAGGDEVVFKYILGFMADAVQNPASLPGVALIMRGDEGVGKGVFATEFGKLFGQHFIQVSTSKHLVGNFNAHLKDGLLVFADEALWAGDKSAQGTLNAMITESLRVIEHKGKDATTVANYLRVIMASNHDWVVPAGPTARRFFVVDVLAHKMQDARYFAAIRKQMDKGGRQALLYFLQEYDLTGFDVRAFPRTAALLDQQIRSMGPEDKFWFERLRKKELVANSGAWGNSINYQGAEFSIIRCSQLYEQYIIASQKSGFSRRSTESELGIALSKLCPEIKKKRRRVPGDPTKLAYYYYLPVVGRCRELFEARMKTKVDWSK